MTPRHQLVINLDLQMYGSAGSGLLLAGLVKFIFF